MSGIRINSSPSEQWILSFLEHLSNGDIILAPVDGTLCLCMTLDSDKLSAINLDSEHFKDNFILLVSSIEAMKQFVDIHPRIETLLSFHSKPLNLFFHDFRMISSIAIGSQSRLIIRKNCDLFWEKLIEDLGKPVVIFPQSWLHDHLAEWNQLPADLLRLIDFWIPELYQGHPKRIPCAYINKAGDLEFINDSGEISPA